MALICGGVFLQKSCSIGGPLREDTPASSFDLGQDPVGWIPQVLEKNSETTAQRLYVIKKTGSWVSFNSVCDRYADSSLQSLSKQLLAPMKSSVLVSSEEKMLDGRASLWTQARGKLDGVPVEALFIVLRKNSCIFDFSLTSKNQILENDEADFKKWVEAFRYRGR